MASCYKCGAGNANQRRTTSTGFSSGSWSSSRSFGSSSRTYYGVRSVCKGCAKAIDTANKIKLIFWIVVIVITVFVVMNRSSSKSNSSDVTSQYTYSGQTARIISKSGLNLRDIPSSTGTSLLAVPYNELVGIIDTNGDSETISGLTEKWYKVDYKGKIGWLWSGYLETK